VGRGGWTLSREFFIRKGKETFKGNKGMCMVETDVKRRKRD